MTDETTDLLIRARSFIERGWCRGTSAAQDVEGNPVSWSDARAVSWCLQGALLAAGMPRLATLSHPAQRRLLCAIGDNPDFPQIGLIGFNNSQQTVESVLAAFDRAIAAR